MRNIVLDTNVLIDYVNGFAFWVEEFLTIRRLDFKLILPTVVIAEYYTSDVFENEKETLVADKTFAHFQKQDLTENIAKGLGKILRRKSYVSSASLADLIIAATTLHLDGVLATRNQKDFAKIPDLRFFDPKNLPVT